MTNKNLELYWESNKGHLKVSEMDTNHIINVIKMLNKNNKHTEDFPECYDNLYIELNERGIDTDFEMDEIFLPLDVESE